MKDVAGGGFVGVETKESKGAVQKAEKRLCEEPFDRLRINSATKQSADFGHSTSRLLRFARNDMYFL